VQALISEIPQKSPHVFGRRLKAVRQKMGLAQDKLGVLVGLDELTASARISRYENGVHEPPVKTAQLIAASIGVPLAYLYCDDDRLADFILKTCKYKDDQWVALSNFMDSMSQVTVFVK
jgi:transcriptional regulator with XRE-family HTH domain